MQNPCQIAATNAPAVSLPPTGLFGTPNQYGSKVRAFASPQTRSRFLRIVWRSGRDCSSVARWLIDEALSNGLMEGLEPREAVDRHEPQGQAIVFRITPRVYIEYKAEARRLDVYQGSVSHLLGLALERTLATRSTATWIEHFADTEDLVDRILRAAEAWVPPLSLYAGICTR